MTLAGACGGFDFAEQVTPTLRHLYDPCRDGGMGVSDLIPNLEDLRAQLPSDGTALDAHEFVEELEAAVSVEDVEVKVDALVDRWLEVADDRGV